MDLQMPAYLESYNFSLGWVPLVSVLGLIWFGTLRRPDRKGRIVTGAVLTVVLLGWYGQALYVGSLNFYRASNTPGVPTIPLGGLLPIFIGLPLLLRSKRVAALVDALPLSWLVGVQYYRAIGVIFLTLWAGGHLPWQFAWPAGLGDIATGVLAVILAWAIARGLSGAGRAAYAWCLFGIADLVIAVAMGTLTSPGITHLLAPGNPNMLITAYPLVMVPTFAVPLSILLHAMCLWKIRRLRQAAKTTTTQNTITKSR